MLPRPAPPTTRAHHESNRPARRGPFRMIALAWTVLLGAALSILACLRVAADDVEARAFLYEVTVETSMPHLEENLRYTRATDRTCVTRSESLIAFPVLKQDAFQACKLVANEAADLRASYWLVCLDSSGTTGRAEWRIDAARIAGTLVVKLGGKNMTFRQHVTATRLGECVPDSSSGAFNRSFRK